jgi:hypothetical protein
MYLVRKGEVIIYLEKGGQQVKLANLSAGAMIGEMALFDNKPRSASAQVISDAEITKISNEDFTKLMKQIPKWFVSLMASLSSRLRETNERLQNLENKMNGTAHPFEKIIRFLEGLDLVWHKDATKDNKNWEIEREKIEMTLARLLDQKPADFSAYIEGFVKGQILELRKNAYKKDILSTPNRGQIRKVIEFLESLKAAMPTYRPFDAQVFQIIDVLDKMADESAYDPVTIPFDDLCEEAAKTQIKTDTWKSLLDFFKLPLPGLSLVKTSTGVGFKIDKKLFKQTKPHITLLGVLKSSGIL